MNFSQVLEFMAEAVASGQLQFPIITVLVGANGVIMAARNDGNSEDMEMLCEYPTSAKTGAKMPINFYFIDPRGNSVHAVMKNDGKIKWVN